MSKPILYRIWQSFDASSAYADDPTIIRYTEPVDTAGAKPGASSTVKARLICRQEACGVRDVQVTWRVEDSLLSAMKCPGCGAPLAFEHYLEERALEPVDWTGVGRKSA